MQLIIRQAIKFVLVGGLNTLVDLGVLNILIWASGFASGLPYSIFKGISFIAAVINSYFLNKFWTFRKIGTATPRKEFSQFLIASAIGFGVNVTVASLVVNAIGPQFGIPVKFWANIGAIAATAVAMTWNFLSYKFIVFKQNEQPRPLS